MNELSVLIPANNIRERSWVIKTIIENFLEIPCAVEISGAITDYTIVWEDKKIIIADFFFCMYEKELSYLHEDHIPKHPSWFDGSLFTDDKLVIIYGKDELIVSEKEIYCGLDIFASSFFMLTRWEEVVLEQKDEFGRCGESGMFVVKHGLYKRAIVNEYVDFLSELLKSIGYPVPKTIRKFAPFITHDVDDLFRYASLKNLCKNFAGDILHRKSVRAFGKTCLNYLRYIGGKIKDPFDTFDELMDLSDLYGFTNAFYFKPSLTGEYDATYDVFDAKVKKIIDNILKRGHEVGIHPSKNTFHDDQQFQLECERLKSLGVCIKGGRQHFLLYNLPKTLRSWNNRKGMEYDAGLGFAFHGGFRCGTCYEYPFFDVESRNELSLRVRPLIVMEGAMLRENKDLNLIEKEMRELADVVYQYGGIFVFLWHNDNFNRYESLRYAHIYKNMIDYLGLLSKK